MVNPLDAADKLAEILDKRFRNVEKTSALVGKLVVILATEMINKKLINEQDIDKPVLDLLIHLASIYEQSRSS